MYLLLTGISALVAIPFGLLVQRLGTRRTLAAGVVGALAAGGLLANVGFHLIPHLLEDSEEGTLTLLPLLGCAGAAFVVLMLLTSRSTTAVRIAGSGAGLALLVHRFVEGLALTTGAVAGGAVGAAVVGLLLVAHSAFEGAFAASATTVSEMTRRRAKVWVVLVGAAPLAGLAFAQLTGLSHLHLTALTALTIGVLAFVAVRSSAIARYHLAPATFWSLFGTGFAAVQVAVSVGVVTST